MHHFLLLSRCLLVLKKAIFLCIKLHIPKLLNLKFIYSTGHIKSFSLNHSSCRLRWFEDIIKQLVCERRTTVNIDSCSLTERVSGWKFNVQPECKSLLDFIIYLPFDFITVYFGCISPEVKNIKGYLLSILRAAGKKSKNKAMIDKRRTNNWIKTTMSIYRMERITFIVNLKMDSLGWLEHHLTEGNVLSILFIDSLLWNPVKSIMNCRKYCWFLHLLSGCI